jgi:pyruvate decarboxylase
VVDETSEQFVGLYNGELTPQQAVKQQIEESDAILHIGPFLSDSNTGGWSQALPPSSVIHLGHDRISFQGTTFKNIHFAPVLKKLVTRISSPITPHPPKNPPLKSHPKPPSPSPSSLLEQFHFWKQFSPFLSANDCIIAEVGSAQYGTLELSLPSNTTFFTQLYYSCIGFTVGALLGALVARREQSSPGRVWLFVGDGSLQMTVQEISTILRHGFAPTIVLINNSGYTIERVIHGPTQPYNDIAPWNYQSMLSFFSPNQSRSYTARTYSELDAVLNTPEFVANKTPQLLEVFMSPFDSPWMLTKQINIVQEKTARALKEWDQKCGRERRSAESNLWQSKHALMDSPSNKFVAGHGG